MYIPPSFRELEPARLHDFIEQHSFGILFSRGQREAVASHLPFLLDRDAGSAGKLRGHMARANDHWQAAAGDDALVVFSGPHAYISPAWYRAKNVVPTWNYLAVHVYGTFRPIEDRGQLQQLLCDTVDTFEPRDEERWSIDRADAEFVDGLLDAIVGFEIEIERIEGKWKLSQNHDRERRLAVAEELSKAGGESRAQIAALMRSDSPARG